MAIYNHASLNNKFHALGDETRREILAAISHKKYCTAGELVDLFNVSQPTISKHLKVLDKAGLVKREIHGRNHIFVLEVNGLMEADGWIKRHLTSWESSLDGLDRFLNENERETP